MESKQSESNEKDIESVKIQYEMERLRKIDEQNRNRSNRYLQKNYSQNKKQISAIISLEAYEEICNRRDASIKAGTPLTAGNIIEQAIFHVCKIVAQPATVAKESTIEIEPDLFNQPDMDISNTEKNVIIDVNTSNEKTEPIPDDLSYYHFNKPPLSDKTAYSVWLNGYIMELHKTGLTNHKVMAELEKQRVKTTRGLDKWQAGTIGNIIAREKRKAEGVDIDAGE